MTLIVVDDFYQDPDYVRKLAISGGFKYYFFRPILRGLVYFPEEIQLKIQNIVKEPAGQIIEWLDSSARFQLWTSKTNKPWIHSDVVKNEPKDWHIWAGVVYLTPNAPLSSGTNFYKHKETNKHFDETSEVTDYKIQHENDRYDITKWDKTDSIANKYNRAVFYNGNLYHCAGDAFGLDENTGRITQAFFFRTEK